MKAYYLTIYDNPDAGVDLVFADTAKKAVVRLAEELAIRGIE